METSSIEQNAVRLDGKGQVHVIVALVGGRGGRNLALIRGEELVLVIQRGDRIALDVLARGVDAAIQRQPRLAQQVVHGHAGKRHVIGLLAQRQGEVGANARLDLVQAGGKCLAQLGQHVGRQVHRGDAGVGRAPKEGRQLEAVPQPSKHADGRLVSAMGALMAS